MSNVEVGYKLQIRVQGKVHKIWLFPQLDDGEHQHHHHQQQQSRGFGDKFLQQLEQVPAVSQVEKKGRTTFAKDARELERVVIHRANRKTVYLRMIHMLLRV